MILLWRNAGRKPLCSQRILVSRSTAEYAEAVVGSDREIATKFEAHVPPSLKGWFAGKSRAPNIRQRIVMPWKCGGDVKRRFCSV
jgi:hypothetical protein